jgi:D-lyxose ketol-isomerase
MESKRLIIEDFRINMFENYSKTYYVYCNGNMNECKNEYCYNEKNKLCSKNDVKIILSKKK